MVLAIVMVATLIVMIAMAIVMAIAMIRVTTSRAAITVSDRRVWNSLLLVAITIVFCGTGPSH